MLGCGWGAGMPIDVADMAFKSFLCALAGAAVWATAAAAAAERWIFPPASVTLHGTLTGRRVRGRSRRWWRCTIAAVSRTAPPPSAQLYGEWAKLLVADGFVVLFPDSFGSRGLGSQCRVRETKVRASRERVADANAARRWLQSASLRAPRAHFAARLVERRHCRALGGAADCGAARRQRRFPLRGRVLSGLPPLARNRLEHAHPDPHPDRQRRRLDAGIDLPTDGRRRPRPQRPRQDHRLSRRPSRIRPRRILRCGCAPASPIPPIPPARRMAAPIPPPAPTRSSACRNGWRGRAAGVCGSPANRST